MCVNYDCDDTESMVFGNCQFLAYVIIEPMIASDRRSHRRETDRHQATLTQWVGYPNFDLCAL